MPLPTDDEIRALHRRFAPTPEAFDLVHTHCVIVSRIAGQLLGPGPDAALVRAGCLLHDIGVHLLRPGDAYLRHGILGHELLRGLGFPEQLCRFCSCHTGVGITRADIERQRLPLPPGDYLPETAEEELVMYADKFHSKTDPPRFVTAASYLGAVRRFGDDKAARFAELVRRHGEPDLTALARDYGHTVA